MECHDAKERLTEGRETAAVRRHLARCVDCAAFVRELESGGRELAQAYLGIPPSGGFAGRVSARIREREISVPVRAGGRLARVLAPALFVLLALALWRLTVPGVPETPKAPPAEPDPVAVTAPERENPVYVSLWRDGAAASSRVHLSFVGESRTLGLAGGVEDALLTLWAFGARRAEVTVSPEVPLADLVRLQTVLDRNGFAYFLSRAVAVP